MKNMKRKAPMFSAAKKIGSTFLALCLSASMFLVPAELALADADKSNVESSTADGQAKKATASVEESDNVKKPANENETPTESTPSKDEESKDDEDSDSSSDADNGVSQDEGTKKDPTLNEPSDDADDVSDTSEPTKSIDSVSKKAASRSAVNKDAEENDSKARDAKGFSTGDIIEIASNEGFKVRYTITDIAAKTVRVGGKGPGPETCTVSYSYAGPLTIPARISAKDPATGANTVFTVTSVADRAFSYYISEYNVPICCKITSLSLPATIQSIGSQAFQRTENLSTVTFPAQSVLSSIGEEAFLSSNISKITIPSSLQKLGDSCFKGSMLSNISFLGTNISSIPAMCFAGTSLLDIDFIPSSVRSIGTKAFEGSKLISAHLPNFVTSLGEGVFYGCTQLKDASIADGSMLTAIPPYTYFGCTSLSEYEIPSFIDSIETFAFSKAGLVVIDVPSNVTYIDESAYAQCPNATSIEFDEKNELMYIQPRVFSGCTNLKDVNLPASIREIRQEAFSGCSALQLIEIPKSCTVLGASTFYNCTALDTVIFNGNAKYLNLETSTFFRDNKIKKVVFRNKKYADIDLYMTASIPTYYYTLTYYNSKKLAMAEGDKSGWISLAAGKVPSSVATAFKYDGNYLSKPSDNGTWIYESNLSPDEPIMDSFFAYRYDPTEELRPGATFQATTVDGVNVTYTVETIASDDGKTLGTVSVGFKDSITTKAAIDTETTGSVTIPEKVVGTDGFTYVVSGICPNAFYDCSGIYSLVVPATVTSIGSRAFARCYGLRDVTFQGSLKGMIDNQWFLGCAKISKVTFGDKKTSISFGTSSPVFYYTVRYYSSKTDMNNNQTSAVLIVKERCLLGSLKATDIVNGGKVPPLRTGYEWVYETGFGAKIPLEDSTKVYQSGVGFQVTVNVNGSPDYSVAACWFSVIDVDEAKKTGTCRVGLGKDLAEKAVHTAINGTVVIPSTVTYDGITYTVTEVSDYAFGSTKSEYSCSYIKGASLPSTVKKIGTCAFAECWDMTSIIIPAAVYSMGTSVFKNCTSLSVANFRSGSLITSMPESTFEGTSKLGTVVLPDKLTSIGTSAFSGTGLKSISFPDTLKTIGDKAFQYASLSGEIEFPKNISSFGEYAFGYCPGISSMLFLGNASKVTCKSNAFYFGEGSAFNSLIYRDKRSNTVGNYIKAYVSKGILKPWYNYNTVSCYKSTSDYNVGKATSYYVYLHGKNPSRTSPLSGTIPTLGKDEAWTYELGFDIDEISYDSFYIIAGRDISKATVTFPQTHYYLTGDYIKPKATVRWSNGAVLKEGIDYTANALKGTKRDGYTNNRTNGVASFHIIGIGDYAGYTSGSFTILDRFDSNGDSGLKTTMSLGTTRYEYDGTAKRPKVYISATVFGITYPIIEGYDYNIVYRNNVNAGTAEAAVVWTDKAPFDGEVKKTFTIDPISLYDCSIVGLKDSEKALNEEISIPTLQITNPYGKVLSKGRDYSTGLVKYGFGMGSIYVTGSGNYTDTVVSNIGYAGEGGGVAGGRVNGNGGTGGGDGAGNGGGTGHLDGEGSSVFNSDGAKSLTSVSANESDSLKNEAGSGGFQALGDGGDGSSAQRRLFEISDAMSVIPLATPPRSYAALIISLIIAAFCIGAGRRPAGTQGKNITTNGKVVNGR